jgi:tRNA 2-thiouridine synthesizing protein A
MAAITATAGKADSPLRTLYEAPSARPRRRGFSCALMTDAVDLDLTGLKCPLPVLRARKALRGLAPGARLVLTCTDPMAAIDIPNLLREDGHRLESSAREDGVLRFSILRGADRTG